MDIKQQIFAFAAGMLIIFLVISQLRKDKLNSSFAALWIGIGLFLVSLGFLGDFYRFIAHSVLNVSGGDHLIYIGLIGFLLVYVFYLTSKICRLIDQVTKLISTVALLESREKK
ncbi:MAG: DUF2304 domain-containing protein [Alphaproteobacteria bacterium]|nr:DUF2304 domain-containing protein [Alphaproteobacteria bacterium]NCQ89131.1 DUF2304 domain-containing protein [Alphaproteobacteria bacterium]NCT08235.1 DUF2304 domain-containing protein [Alphaproteobacteria bacterium]